MEDDTPDPHVLEPGHAPTPFTGAEIRDATTVGKTIRRRVDALGEASFLIVSKYLECDEDGALMERSMLSLEGAPLGVPDVDRVAWLDLQWHASFPADATTIGAERIQTPLGELGCLRYTVREGSTEKVFWFATDLPGMPIKSVVRTDGQVVNTSVVVENTTS